MVITCLLLAAARLQLPETAVGDGKRILHVPVGAGETMVATGGHVQGADLMAPLVATPTVVTIETRVGKQVIGRGQIVFTPPTDALPLVSSRGALALTTSAHIVLGRDVSVPLTLKRPAQSAREILDEVRLVLGRDAQESVQ